MPRSKRAKARGEPLMTLPLGLESEDRGDIFGWDLGTKCPNFNLRSEDSDTASFSGGSCYSSVI
jgi:hypothetical protein